MQHASQLIRPVPTSAVAVAAAAIIALVIAIALGWIDWFYLSAIVGGLAVGWGLGVLLAARDRRDPAA
ncbi:hypothetical protein [Pseudoroseicyclus sp. CXY001]|uniref:hypothetical protein n=1 Tax=Pseudoroseicyclus sp. CXY001 TaxID=3242492 RepID=UPI0035711BD2